MDFVFQQWNYGGTLYLSKQIGLVQITGFIVSLIFIFGNRLKKWRTLFSILTIFFAGSLLLMLPLTDFVWSRITLLQKFQFPWRLLSLVVFTASVISSFAVAAFKNTKFTMLYVIGLSILALIIYYPFYQAKDYLLKPESFYSGIYYSTTDTGESGPRWSVRFMEHTASASSEFIEGIGSIHQTGRSSTKRQYSIKVDSSSARIRENTLYFPNWEVFVNGKKVPVEFQDRLNRGLITYNIDKGENKVLIKFGDTKLRIISNLTSLTSLITLFVFGVFSFRTQKIK